MTALAPTPGPGVLALGSARLLAGATHGSPVDLARHRSLHGPRRPLDLTGLVAATESVHLLGRGGAAFPVATKLRATPSGPGTSVLVNGSESEPASRKDRTLMTLVPHLVLDGALVVAEALGSRRVVVAVHDEASYAGLRAALAERRRSEPTGISVEVLRQPARFVGGEVRALMRGLDGGPAVPPGHRVLPSRRGLGGRPTFASNVETFAQIAVLAALGPTRFAEVGDPHEPGTTLLTLLGDVPTPGVVEVPSGLPLRALLPDAARPVLVGGYHGRWTSRTDLTLSRPALRAAGLPLNAAVVARLPRDTCALGEVAAVATWLAGQSAGQCGPCVFGTASVARDLTALAAGHADRDALARLGVVVPGLPGRGACAHPDGTAAFVGTALDALADEVAAHVHRGHCGRPVRGVLPTGGAR
ncbi:NADH-ubiquinone oxidoreductase-F iron-sulfur binding region domain-containing protein [Nocardioides mangrovi]|uniref:NADH-ubiquinone oxidoreductase 51kDa subunit iron-sulphur binding domain-containing protein n=1 Tax=Nocardioides mangrovi TaxID=2874580 RepID=A0ABS7UA75_9ACTN|nr:NADH-ubiquinone oxidoreductase-F iron-sulfur binding region domain-containing protein [Nocardioides mangrovi]MBZ5737890.1 hypothetical protein [Nocardioides mangrovi]